MFHSLFQFSPEQMTTQQLYDELMEGYLLQTREQIQQDLITLLDSQFGEVEYLDEVKTLACQIVVDNFVKFFPKTNSL
jgi:hypothetical protein